MGAGHRPKRGFAAGEAHAVLGEGVGLADDQRRPSRQVSLERHCAGDRVRSMTYYLTYLGLLIAALLGEGDRQARVILYWIALFGLFVFSGFRYQVGCDWSGYLIHFSFRLDSYAEVISLREPGHWSLIRLLHQFDLPYQYLNVATSAMFFVGLHALARRQPNSLAFLVLAFPILIVNMPMSAIRQGAAIGFACLAFVAFIDRRIVAYVCWLLVGSLFHSSALAFIVFAPFIWGQFTKKNLLIASVLALPGLFVLMQTEAAEIAASRYIERDIDAAGSGFRLGILSLSGLFFLLMLAPSWRRQFPEDYRLVTIGSYLMVGFFSLFFVSTVIGDRFGYYLIPIQLMIFARIPFLKGLSSRQLWSLAPYAGLTIVFVVWTQLSWHFDTCFIPYDIRFGAPTIPLW